MTAADIPALAADNAPPIVKLFGGGAGNCPRVQSIYFIEPLVS